MHAGPAAGSADENGPGVRARPQSPDQLGTEAEALPAAAEVAIVVRLGYVGYALVRLAVRAGRHAAFAHAAGLWRLEWPAAPGRRAVAQPPSRRLTWRFAPDSLPTTTACCTSSSRRWCWAGCGCASLPCSQAAALGAGAGHHRGEPGVLDLARRAALVLRAGHDRCPRPLRHPRRGRPARRHQPGEPVRRHAQPARRLGHLVRGSRHHRHPQPVAAPGLALPLGHHPACKLASANHFLLDAVAGLAITTLGLLATRAHRPPDTAEPRSCSTVPFRHRPWQESRSLAAR